ncbi:MAG: GlsB/YeaQ/YmgE family stress response membrane protein [Armatimonadaceae bacterium]
MSLLIFLIVGLLAGIIAKAVMPGSRNEPSGWLMTIVLGIAGAFVGGFIGNLIGIGSDNFIGQTLIAAVGAIVIIGLLRLFTRSHA